MIHGSLSRTPRRTFGAGRIQPVLDDVEVIAAHIDDEKVVQRLINTMKIVVLISGLNRFLQLAGTVLERKPETQVFVKADFRATHGQVVTAMVLLQKAGAEKVGFLTDPAQLESLKGLEGSG